MKLYANEKTFPIIHHKIFIKDENDMDIYEISSKFRKTTINDMNENKIDYIEKKYFSITPNYNIYINNEPILKIKKINPFENEYLLSNGCKVTGDFRMLNFVIYDGKNNQIGNIKRTTKFISIGGSDKYEIDIIDLTKKEIILAILVPIADYIRKTSSD